MLWGAGGCFLQPVVKLDALQGQLAGLGDFQAWISLILLKQLQALWSPDSTKRFSSLMPHPVGQSDGHLTACPNPLSLRQTTAKMFLSSEELLQW